MWLFAQYSEVFPAVVLLPLLFIMGLLVGGPNNIITSAICADMASHPSVKGSTKSLGTITGLINGCGAITASAGQLLVPIFADNFGWYAVWYYLMFCCATGTLLISSKIYEELVPPVKPDFDKV